MNRYRCSLSVCMLLILGVFIHLHSIFWMLLRFFFSVSGCLCTCPLYSWCCCAPYSGCLCTWSPYSGWLCTSNLDFGPTLLVLLIFDSLYSWPWFDLWLSSILLIVVWLSLYSWSWSDSLHSLLKSVSLYSWSWFDTLSLCMPDRGLTLSVLLIVVYSLCTPDRGLLPVLLIVVWLRVLVVILPISILPSLFWACNTHLVNILTLSFWLFHYFVPRINFSLLIIYTLKSHNYLP